MSSAITRLFSGWSGKGSSSVLSHANTQSYEHQVILIIIIIIIIIINFIYVSGYLTYKLIGDTTKTNTEIKCF